MRVETTTITCDHCGKNIPNTRESDYYTLTRKTHFMIPYRDDAKHFCSRRCLTDYFTASTKGREE